MKLLVQSDDYGMSEACALGCLKGIQDGIIRNTGLFVNMPWTKKCVEWIKPYLGEIAFGIDLNISSGAPVLPASEIPGLVQSNGQFLTSQMHRSLDNDDNDFDHLNFDEVYKEFDAQIKKFIELVGKKPDYLHGHAYGTKTTQCIMQELSKKYKIPLSTTLIHHKKVNAPSMEWYKYPVTYENQLTCSLEEYILQDKAGFLDSEYGLLITHCGYVDNTLMKMTSFHLLRMKDLEGVTSPQVLKWIEKNQVELITYRDISKLIWEE
ncbi:MAG: ChbG/HpnK family deacetylase [Longibaculum sp.]